jgi:hypothetical protein
VTSEVIYFYLKGQGWLAGYEEHVPKPAPVRDDAWFEDVARWDQMIARVQRQATRYTYGTPVPVPMPQYQEYRRMQQVPRETIPQVQAGNERYWRDYERIRAQGTPIRVTTTAGTAAGANPPRTVLQTHDELYDWYTTLNTHRPRTPNPPTPRTQEELERNQNTRYYPGAGQAAEPARAENQHERRIREYREALERARRGR